MHTNSRKQLLVNVLTVVISTIVGLALAEVTLRILHVSPPEWRRTDPATGLMTFPPGATLEQNGVCFSNTIHTNTDGFHAFEHSKEKPTNVFRIALVGDSFVEAVHVTREKHVATLLEQALRAHATGTGMRIEVIPFGMSGNGTYLNMLYTKAYVLAYKPNLIVDMFFIGNDPANDNGVGTHQPRFDEDGRTLLTLPRDERSKFYLFTKEVAKKSALVRTLYRAYLTERGGASGESVEPKTTTLPRERHIYLVDEPADVTHFWEVEKLLLRDWKTLAEKAGAQLAVAGISEALAIHPDLAGMAFSDIPEGLVDVIHPEHRLASTTQMLGIPYEPLANHFRTRARQTGERSHFPCDWHWNEVGHAWASEALLPFLLDFVPDA